MRPKAPWVYYRLPSTLACVVFSAAAARLLAAGEQALGCGGAAAAFARQDGDLRPASSAPLPTALQLAHRPAMSAACAWACAWAWALQLPWLPLARTVTCCPPRLRLGPPLVGLPSALHVGGLLIGFGFAALVFVGRALRLVV